MTFSVSDALFKIPPFTVPFGYLTNSQEMYDLLHILHIQTTFLPVSPDFALNHVYA